MMRTKHLVCVTALLTVLVGYHGTVAQVCFVSNYATPGYTYCIDADGIYAYVGVMGLQIIDVTDPSSPSPTGSMSGGPTLDVTVNGSYVYVACLNCGFNIIDISDPGSPTLTGNYATPGPAMGVDVVGEYAYVGAHEDGFLVIDISNPTSPTLTGSYDTPGTARGLTVVGDYAYLADGPSGLQIIDISDPASPTPTGSIAAYNVAQDVDVAGNYAYVADHSGLFVIDITDPTSPTLAGEFVDSGNNGGVTVAGDYAYQARDQNGLQIIDISDPTSPTLVENYITPGEAGDVAVHGSYIYIADYDEGLTVLEIGDFPSFPVDSPVGGESWCAGESHEITWGSCSSSFYVMIEYSTNGGTDWEPVTASTPNDGSYSWTIPDTPSIDCLVRICDPQDTEICEECESAFKISGCGPLGIMTETLPDGTEKIHYEEYLVATGGVLPYSWTLVEGELPSGLNLDTVMGSISGKPQEFGTFCFTIELQEDLGATDTREYCITIGEYTGMTGDINFDGEINILDVLATVNHVLGIEVLTGDALGWADCSGDDQVNIIDTLGIVNVLLDIGECAP
ncbi:MAG: hypothetical protein JSV84_09630 [Gemmatimonadota bacterium]|nr:MAG: hypothetical protein JSV84_09630 [Gemmatimonadota bacterium]